MQWTAASNLVSFTVNTRKGSVQIRSVDGDGQAPYELLLFNSDGAAIESIETVTADARLPFSTESAPWNDLLNNLYQTARSNAIDLENVIKGILDEVENPPGSDDDIPF